MLRREILLVLRARVTWIAAALSALLVGHGFVLATDIFSSASRSALASTLMRREMDPLAGIVRPMLGGLELATALLVPLVAARSLSIEKERGGFGALLLQIGSGSRVVAAKLVAAFIGASLLFVAPLGALTAFTLVGGHLDVIETTTALLGHLFHLVLVTAIALAAAAWSETVATAVTLSLIVSLGSWAIDASEGFSAVSWLAPLERLSLGVRLAPFEHGIFSLEQAAAISAMTAGAIALAIAGIRPNVVRAVVVVVVTTTALVLSTHVHRAFDWSEQRRASFPPAVVDALRALPEPITIEVWLDREDSRRRELEADTLAKLRLARDVDVITPSDMHSDYGKLVIHVGDASVTTRSTSRSEIVTLIFATAKRPLPAWNQPDYPGYPIVIEGGRRTFVVVASYLIFPGVLFTCGLVVTRTTKRRKK